MMVGLLTGRPNGQYGLFTQKLRSLIAICGVWMMTRLIVIPFLEFLVQGSSMM